MKTTIDIPDALLDEARRRARDEGTTMRELVADGLRAVLARRAEPSNGFEMPAFDGEPGFQPGMDAEQALARETMYPAEHTWSPSTPTS